MIAIVFKFPIDLKVLIGEEHLGFFEHYIIKRVVQSLWKVSMSKKIQGQPYECTLWNVDSDPTTLIVQAIWSSDANDAQMLEMLQYSRYMQSIAMESTNTFLLKSNAFDILKYIDNEKPRKTD